MANRRKTRKKISLSVHRPDWFLVGTMMALVVFGIMMIANASSVAALRDFNNKLHFAQLQAQWAVLGSGAFLVSALFPYHRLRRYVPLMLIGSIGLLILVILPNLGLKVFGAQRWIRVGSFHLQPTEVAKLSYILYLAAYLEKKKKPFPVLVCSVVLVGLIMLQPDLGSSVIVVASGLFIYFAAGSPWWHTFGLIITGAVAGLGLTLLSEYRRSRLLTFLDPVRDPLGASYHLRQILIAVGSGGLTGVGLGKSRQKYEYLPAVATDSIFAVVAEELGFIGGLILLAVYLFFIWRGLRVAQRSEDVFGRLLAVGLVGWLGFQAAVNLAAMVSLVPLTGITLPFISYGGSSLILSMTAVGILVNISRYTYE